MIDERRTIVRHLNERFFGDGSNHFLCARILLEQIKLDLACGNSLDKYEFGSQKKKMIIISFFFAFIQVNKQTIFRIIFENVRQLPMIFTA